MVENVCCCVERSALTEQCDDKYTIEDKIDLILNSLMKIYNIPKAERQRAIKTVLELDYVSMSEELFKKLATFVNRRCKKLLDDAIKAEFY